ncbi:toll/interleukin-1 receptor domain-containing protein [bacterium]|nr:toll/interleukin-1 receptor domain-containing protein [bacterium]
MKVFISWSGTRSKAMANALKEWIPLIVQHAKPFVSDKDISAGDRWAQAIAGELESSDFGILCITPENISSEWIMFEAGALSKSMQVGKVIPLLFGLELSDLSGPL